MKDLHIHKFIEENKLFDTSSTLLLGLSGGKDSMALLHWLRRNKYCVHAVHINYNLRNSSQSEAQFVKKICNKWHIPSTIYNVRKQDIPQSHIQEWARKFRYDFFEEKRIEINGTHILVAHHMEDHIETFFLKFLKSRMHSSLTGMKSIQKKVVRPLLETSVAEIKTYITFHHIPYIEDASNRSDKYFRNKIRHHLLPNIEKLTDSYPENILLSMQSIQMKDKIIDEYVSLLANERCNFDKEAPLFSTPSVNINGLSNVSALHLLSYFFKVLGEHVHPAVCREMIHAQTNARWTLSRHTIKKDRNQQLSVLRQYAKCSITIHALGKYAYLNKTLSISKVEKVQFQASSHVEYIAYRDLRHHPILLRNIQKGDNIKPLGMGGKHKLISKVLKDQKILMHEYSDYAVLVDVHTNEIIWLTSLKLSESFKYSGNGKALQLIWS